MSKALYWIYVVIVVLVVLVAGRDDEENRNWGGSAGRSGWSSGTGHK